MIHIMDMKMTEQQKINVRKRLRKFYYTALYSYNQKWSQSMTDFLFLELIYWDAQIK